MRRDGTQIDSDLILFEAICSRLLFGTTQLFVFVHPEQTTRGSFSEVTFELAQEEIAAKAGYTIDNEDQTMEVALLNKDLMEVLPGIDEANAISEELERNIRFEVMLVAPQILGRNLDRTEACVHSLFTQLFMPLFFYSLF